MIWMRRRPDGVVEYAVPPTTRLVTRQYDPMVPTLLCEEDSPSALCRALVEYLAPLEATIPAGGRVVRFAQALDDYPESEDNAAYPALAVVAGMEPGRYVGDGLTPSVAPKPIAPATPERGDLYLVTLSGYEMDMQVMIFGDPEERAALGRAVEQALMPVNWMFGVRLELPYYFGQRVEFTPLSFGRLDDPDNAQRGIYPGVMLVRGRLAVQRLARLERGNYMLTAEIR